MSLVENNSIEINLGDSILVGPQGEQGKQGPQGEQGLSAYDVAVKNGYEGTEDEWLNSLKVVIEDSKTATDTTWSSQKISDEFKPINAYKSLDFSEMDGLMVAVETGLLYKNPTYPESGHILFGNILNDHEYKVNVLKKGDRFRIYLYNEYNLKEIDNNKTAGNLVFDDSSQTEATFTSEKYNFAIIMLSNSKVLYNEKGCAEIFNSDYKYDLERETYIRPILYREISDLNNKLNNEIFDVDVNNEELWEVGNIDGNGEFTDEDKESFIRTKDFIDSDVYKITNTSPNNARVYIYNKETSEFIKSVLISSEKEDYINIKMDEKYKIKYNKDLISDPLYIKLYTLSKYSYLKANSEELNNRVGDLETTSEELNNRVGDLETTSEELNNEIFDVDVNNEELWEVGNISYSTGELEVDNFTIRTKDFIDLNILKAIKSLENSKTIGIRIYDLEGNFIKAYELMDTAILDTDSYKYKFIIKSSALSDFTALKFIKAKTIDKYLNKEANIFPQWVKWDDVRYNYGFDKNLQSIFKTVHGVLESDTMISVRGGKGRWNKTDKPTSTFVSGGHVFEGWSGKELCRLTMLIGKFHETFACIQTYSPAGLYETNRRFGWIKFGSDELRKGFDVSQDWTKCYTPFTLAILSSAPTKVPDADLNPQLSEYSDSVPVGTMYYDLTLKKVRVYTENGWKNLAFE